MPLFGLGRPCPRSPLSHNKPASARPPHKKSGYSTPSTASGLALYRCREVRPLLNAEGSYVADTRREPRERRQRLDSAKKDAHVLVVEDVETSLGPTKAVTIDEQVADLLVGAGHVPRPMRSNLCDIEVKGEGVHL